MLQAARSSKKSLLTFLSALNKLNSILKKLRTLSVIRKRVTNYLIEVTKVLKKDTSTRDLKYEYIYGRSHSHWRKKTNSFQTISQLGLVDRSKVAQRALCSNLW